MKLIIYDAQNYFRVKLESADGTILTTRAIFSEMMASTDINVMVWDGKGGNERRKALYPAYKSKRKPASEPIWEGMKFLRGVLDCTPAISVCVPGYEADDVIAHLALRYALKGLSVHIMSTDGDLTQLCQVPTITHMRGEMTKCPPNLVRLYKTTVGDPSDCISGIPGFGEKSWENADKTALLAFVEGRSHDLEAIGVKATSKVGEWMMANRHELEVMWTITGFLPISEEDVNKYTKRGVANIVAAEALFRENLM